MFQRFTFACYLLLVGAYGHHQQVLAQKAKACKVDRHITDPEPRPDCRTMGCLGGRVCRLSAIRTQPLPRLEVWSCRVTPIPIPQ